MDKEKMNGRELTEKELEMVSGGSMELPIEELPVEELPVEELPVEELPVEDMMFR